MKLGIKEENGSTFAYILVVMVVSFLLVAGLIQVTTGENNQARYQTDYMKAYYIARAGAESMAMEMERMDNSKYIHFYGDGQTAEAINMLDGIGEANVSVKRVSDQGHYRITSVGTYEDVSATVKIMMQYRKRSELDFGVYAKDDMEDLQVKNTFKSDIGSGGDISYHNLADENTIKNNGSVSPNTMYNIQIQVPDIDEIFYSGISDKGKYYDENQTGIKLSEEELENVEEDIEDKIDSGELLEGDIKPLGIYANDFIINESLIINEWKADFSKTGSGSTITINTNNAEYSIQAGEDYEDTFKLVKDEEASEKWIVLYIEEKAYINSKVTISITGEHNVMIIAEKGLELLGGIQIPEDGDNKISFYIMDQPASESGLTIEINKIIGIEERPDLLTFYLNPKNDITANINNNPDLYAYIIGPEAEINLKNGSTILHGGIYGKNVDFDAEISVQQEGPSNPNVTLYKQMGIDYWE